jgi:Flp pilus assembly protein TadG
MNSIKTLAFAAVAVLSLGAGAAMAQEGPNATVSGSTYFGNQTVQSGSSDVETRPTVQWTPGVVVDNLPVRNAY